MIKGDINMTVTSLGVKTSKKIVEYGLPKAGKTRIKARNFVSSATISNPISKDKVFPSKQVLRKSHAARDLRESSFVTKADLQEAKIQVLTWGTLFFIACMPMVIGILRYTLG